MFLEEKKAGESQVQQPSLLGMIAWLEKMPATEHYNYIDPFKCACAQYAQSIGAYGSWMHRADIGVMEFSNTTWGKLDALAYAPRKKLRTFGHLLQSMKSVAEKNPNYA